MDNISVPSSESDFGTLSTVSECPSLLGCSGFAAAVQQHAIVANDDRPSCLSKATDAVTCMECLDKEHELSLLERNAFKDMQMQAEVQPKKRKKRSVKSLRPCCCDEKGQLQHLEPRKTVWYLAHALGEPECPKLRQKFRRRFRMPCNEFSLLLQRAKQGQEFQRWQRKDATGKDSSPIELLVLGSLWCLGRGIVFDDLEESTAISEETHRVFFHVFVWWGRAALCPLCVHMPRTAEEYKTHQAEFATGCLPGAGFSADGTNVLLWRCTHNLKQAHIGFKDSHPARTYDLTCNHRRRILHTTQGCPERWNDKSLAIHDEFMCGVHEGKILQDVRFELLEWEGRIGKSPVVRVKCRGAWGLVDNGYHRWPSTQAPSKLTNWLPEKRLSDWTESFRKDSECTFGTLKGRWRILKTGIRLEGPAVADNIWFTCCALHNWSLEVDGLSGEWEGQLGNNDSEDFRLSPKAMQRLNDLQLEAFGSREHEEEARRRRQMAGGDTQLEDLDNPTFGEVCGEARVDNEGAICVNCLAYQDFRRRLVTHFDTQHRRRKIAWPKRKKGNT